MQVSSDDILFHFDLLLLSTSKENELTTASAVELVCEYFTEVTADTPYVQSAFVDDLDGTYWMQPENNFYHCAFSASSCTGPWNRKTARQKITTSAVEKRALYCLSEIFTAEETREKLARKKLTPIGKTTILPLGNIDPERLIEPLEVFIRKNGEVDMAIVWTQNNVPYICEYFTDKQINSKQHYTTEGVKANENENICKAPNLAELKEQEDSSTFVPDLITGYNELNICKSYHTAEETREKLAKKELTPIGKFYLPLGKVDPERLIAPLEDFIRKNGEVDMAIVWYRNNAPVAFQYFTIVINKVSFIPIKFIVAGYD